jgi:hypothetical protein
MGHMAIAAASGQPDQCPGRVCPRRLGRRRQPRLARRLSAGKERQPVRLSRARLDRRQRQQPWHVRLLLTHFRCRSQPRDYAARRHQLRHLSNAADPHWPSVLSWRGKLDGASAPAIACRGPPDIRCFARLRNPRPDLADPYPSCGNRGHAGQSADFPTLRRSR